MDNVVPERLSDIC